MKYQPFSEGYYAKHTWEMLTNTNKKRNNNEGNQDFVRLWSQITLRHTKLMVHDDIKLPPQNRILLSIPFNPVEQENYNQLFEEFLAAICLDQYGNPVMDDWEPTPFILTHMRHSLTRLRQVCCNPQVGRLNFGSRRYKSRNHLFYGRGGQAGVTAVLQLKTLENVLDEMLSKASDLISDSEKEKAQLFLDVAEFLEYLYLPEIALETLNIGVWETERIIYRLSKYLDKLMNEYKIMKKFQKENGGEGDSEEADDDEDDELSDEEGKTNSVVHSVKNEKNENLVKLEDKITTTRLRLRSWNVMLHKFYFLIASSHFQQYDEEFQQKIEVDGKYAPILASVPGLDEFKQDLDKIHTSKDNLSPLLCGISTADLLPINSLTGFDGNSSISPHEFQEKFYYNLAERVREKILESSIKAVLNAVKHKITARSIYEPDKNKFLDNGDYHLHKNSKKLFKYLPLIDINSLEDNYIIGMRSKLFFTKVQKLIDQLNNQSKLINEWMDELIKLLSKPLLSHDKDPNGAEYEESIDDQDKVSCFLHVLSQIIIDRSEFIVGSDSKSIANNNITNTNNNKRAQQDALTEELLSNVNNKEFLLALQDSRKSVKPQLNTSLQELALNASNLESDLMQSQREEEEIENNVGRLEFDLFQQFTIRIRKIFENQKLSEVLIQKELSSNCNAVFNSRIEYFKQLQQISDSVRSVWQREYPVDLTSARELFVSILEKYAKTNQEINQKMTKSIAKFRYLQSLVRPEDSPKSADDEDDLMCTICRSLITIGSLTQCGHKYCKECLEHWLQNSRSCPMCKTLITEHSVYNFTHHKPNLKANTVHEKDDDSLHGDKADKLHVIYKSLDEGIIENIQEIEMKTSYSTKVDMIIKQVLYLKMQEPGVQIVIFSQWQDLLYIIGTALKNVNVSFLASHGTLTPEIGGGRRRNKYDSVEQFKKQDLGITCFLLNAKAQASGLTLINATHIFLCEPLVNTSLELQAISRIHRIGQTKLTTVWMFAIENTVEESIVLMSTNKRLQYFEQKKSTSTKKDSNTAASKAAADRDLSKAESITMLNSGGIDTLVSKGQSEGESVTNGDLWNAFFSASSTKPVTAFSNLK